MSNFICEKCHKTCYDTDRGYVTGCIHYPPDVAAVNHLHDQYIETRKALKDLWETDGFIDDELIKKIKDLLSEHR